MLDLVQLEESCEWGCMYMRTCARKRTYGKVSTVALNLAWKWKFEFVALKEHEATRTHDRKHLSNILSSLLCCAAVKGYFILRHALLQRKVLGKKASDCFISIWSPFPRLEHRDNENQQSNNSQPQVRCNRIRVGESGLHVETVQHIRWESHPDHNELAWPSWLRITWFGANQCGGEKAVDDLPVISSSKFQLEDDPMYTFLTSVVDQEENAAWSYKLWWLSFISRRPFLSGDR